MTSSPLIIFSALPHSILLSHHPFWCPTSASSTAVSYFFCPPPSLMATRGWTRYCSGNNSYGEVWTPCLLHARSSFPEENVPKLSSPSSASHILSVPVLPCFLSLGGGVNHVFLGAEHITVTSAQHLDVSWVSSAVVDLQKEASLTGNELICGHEAKTSEAMWQAQHIHLIKHQWELPH